jgi:hypothetical protein
VNLHDGRCGVAAASRVARQCRQLSLPGFFYRLKGVAMLQKQWSDYIDDPEEWSDRCASDPQWVAECLSRIGRFGGQHPKATVLAHSLDLFERLSSQPAQVQLWSLYHDAHEILTSDIPRKFKHEDITRFQNLCDALLQEKLGVLVIDSIVLRMDIKQGDHERKYWEHYHSMWSDMRVAHQIDAFVNRTNLMKGFLK